MSIRKPVRCDEPRYFTAKCPRCQRVHAHRVACRKRNTCPGCNYDARVDLRDGYGPLIDQVVRGGSHRVFAVTATHDDDPRVRLRRAFSKLGCSGLIAADYEVGCDGELLPFFSCVLVFDDDPGLLEVKLRAARCSFDMHEASKPSEIDRAIFDLIPLRDAVTAHAVVEHHPDAAQFCKVRAFGELLRGKRIEKPHHRTLEEIKTCIPCETYGLDQPDLVVVRDDFEADRLRAVVRKLRGEGTQIAKAKRA